MSSIGPSLPPHLQKARPSSAVIPDDSLQPSSTQDNEESEDDDFGPALPPHLLVSRKQGPSAVAGPSRPPVGPTRPASPPKRSVGPALPPGLAGSQSDNDDDDDDDVGPSLSAAMAGPSRPGEGSAARDFREREERWAKEREIANAPKEMKREEWMLVPPTAGTLAESLGDPLKMRARGFAKASDAPRPNQDMTLWTETPAERQQRLRDEMMGKKRKKENADDVEVDADSMKKRRRDMEIEDRIREHNSQYRAASLVESHQSNTAKAKKDKKSIGEEDAPAAIWDRELHMGVTGKLMDDGDRNKVLKDAKNLGDRFGRGSYIS